MIIQNMFEEDINRPINGVIKVDQDELEKSFELFDGKGNKLYYGADCRSAAERSLVKLLFPLNYQ